MHKRAPYLLLSTLAAALCLALLLLLPRTAQTSPAGPGPSFTIPGQNSDKLDDALLEALAQTPTGASLPFIVHLHARADLSPTSLPAGKSDRHATIVARLQNTATQSQAPLLASLDHLVTAGEAHEYRPFWIVNAVAVSGTQSALTTIAARPEVSHIVLDAAVQMGDWETFPLGDDLPTPWGITSSRVPHTHAGLGVTGAGIVIAIMDSGVDWLHPALYDNYRGTLGNGSVIHAGNWYDAVNWNNVYPIDPFGHGTHVAGTAVGGEGLGVAPGAEWMAVRAFDSLGLSNYSILHDAFQWLLAPLGDPALAPDIINGSWTAGPDTPEFLPDVAALEAAGILFVAAAGNSGNVAGTLGVPAAYPEVLAAGAYDMRDRLTWFSSIGPSSFTGNYKPTLVGPGARVLSALPGASYGYASGTSMATPHLAGAAALLLSTNEDLPRPALTTILTASARPLEGNEPSMRTGWGALDVYAALREQVPAGRISGVVTSNGAPLAGVTVTVSTPAGVDLPFFTAADGSYDITLQPGSYDLLFSAFGYAPAARAGLQVQAGGLIVENVALTRLPHGTLSGVVREAGSNNGLPATIRVAGTPLTATANASGNYSLELPAGTYQLTAAHTGHRLAQATVTVPANSNAIQDFTLEPADRVLLVDSGWWYYNSQAAYYRDSLNDLALAHDEWPVYSPIENVPQLDDLSSYDVVLWSAPSDSPGILGAGTAISSYLGLGGDLFISGSRIGQLDGNIEPQAWWFLAMRGVYVRSLQPVGVPPAAGQPGTPFAGLNFTLNGGDGARNQFSVDQVTPLAGSFTAQAFNYGDELIGAGLMRGKCVDQGYHLVYLGFGLEGVSARSSRTEILARSLDYFNTPPEPAGLRLQPEQFSDLVVPGQTYTYTLTLINDGETVTDTYSLALTPGAWSGSILTPTLTVGPCQTAQTQLRFTIPPGLPDNTQQTFTVTATSGNDPALSATAQFDLKTPGRILLVDDHRFYAPEALYRAALDELGLSYDEWVTGWAGNGRGSPPPLLLQQYDFVLWYTGYDWFQPVTEAEADALAAYLDGGGRLFLSSQDFLHYNFDHQLARHYLGVLAYRESVTPTIAYGDHALSFGEGGPYLLDYTPYQNNSDGLLARTGSQVHLWHNGGGAAGLTTAGTGSTGRPWRTLFWAFPLEKLPEAEHTQAMARILGQLSDLGDTTFVAGRRSAPAGSTLPYTLTLRNDGPGNNSVTLTNTLPAELTLQPNSLTGGALYDPIAHQITWQGEIVAGGVHTITYLADTAPSLPAGTRLENLVAISYDRHELTFQRSAVTWIAAPELAGSQLILSANPLPPGRNLTLTLFLHNQAASGNVSATLRLPTPLNPVTTTLQSSASAAQLAGRQLSWQGELQPNAGVTVTLVLTTPWRTTAEWVPLNLILNDGATAPLIRSTWLYVTPFRVYMPAVWK